MRTIELGGGNNPQYRPNYDIRPLPNVDTVIDLNYPIPVPNNSYEFVFSRYFIEHVSYRNIDNLFMEIYRILVPSGKLEIITANLFEQAKVLINTSQWNQKLISMIFGDQNYNENAHQCGFSPEYITRILKNIGFKDIQIEPIYTEVGPTDMKILATK